MKIDQEFDIARCKVPRKDKQGNDITGDALGGGGRHRPNGTISGMAYDFEIIDESFCPEERDSLRTVTYDDLPWWGQLVSDVIETTLPLLLDKLTEAGKKRFSVWLDEHRKKKCENSILNCPEPKKNKRFQTKAERLLYEAERQKVIVALPSYVQNAYSQYSINMTSEEAQKELIDAVILHILSVHKFWRVANASITDNDNSITNGKVMITQICNSPLIDEMNILLSKNPSLIDEWQAMVLSNIVGYEVIADSAYIPFTGQKLRHCILASS